MEDQPSVPDETSLSPPPKPAIGHLAVRGMVWTTGLTLGTKLVSIIQQFLIARNFLSEQDFGLVAMGQVVVSLASIGHSLAISEIMARRTHTFHRWAQAAITLSFSAGLFGTLLLLAIIPFWPQAYLLVSHALGSRVEHAPAIQGLLAVWCVGLPFDTLATVFNARLRVDLRFRTLGLINATQVIMLAVLSICFAALKFGPYALVLPIPLQMISCCLLSKIVSRQRVRWRLDLHRWPSLLKEARYFLVGTIFLVFLQQGDYLVTGLFFEEVVLGAYYFAFRLSTQTVQLIGANVGAILVPSFAKLHEDPQRQVGAYERCCEAMLVIGMPLCFLQATLAGPFFHLIFGSKWDRALPLFQILSLAMGFSLPMATATSLLVAQGRIRLNMVLTAIQAVMFVTFVFIGALFRSVVGVAICVGSFYVLFGPLTAALPVIRNGRSPWKFLLHAYGVPLLCGASALAGAWALPAALPASGDLLQLVLRGIGWTAALAIVFAALRPPSFLEVLGRARSLVRSRS